MTLTSCPPQCNREWPCNHCQKRKVADKCRFNNPASPSERLPPPPGVSKKRSRNFQDDDQDTSPSEGSLGSNDDDLDLESLGYMAGPLLSSLTMDNKVWDRPAASVARLN